MFWMSFNSPLDDSARNTSLLGDESADRNRRHSVGPDKQERSWVWPLALVLILALALVLRLWRIDAQSIWYDEGWSIHLAQGALSHALEQIGSEGHTHPPGYYLLLMGWVRLFGYSVLAARGLSALLGALTVWAIYRLGQTLFDRVTGLLSALLLAIAPAHVIYSQETRMYALLVLCLTGLLGLTYRYAARREAWSGRDWTALILLEIVAVYTHYFALFALLGMAGWLLVPLLAQARKGQVRPLVGWLSSQFIVFLAFLPWIGVALQRAATHAAQGATPPALPSFVLQVWSFLMGGHIALYGRQPLYATMVQVSVATTGLLTLGLFVRAQDRRQAAYLLVQGIVPAGLVFLLMQARPGFHPRYVLMLLIPLLVLVARGVIVMVRGKAGAISRLSPLSFLFLCLWLSTTGLAAKALLTDAYYARDDARRTVVYLQKRLEPNAVVLVDNDDWALRYYLGDSELTDLYLTLDQLAEDVVDPLSSVLQGHPQAALVKWHQGETDKRGLLPYLLERGGTLVEKRHLPGYTVYVYTLDQESPPLSWRNVNVSFAPLRLVDVSMEALVPADEAITVALTWHKDAEVVYDYKVALRLVDQAGRSLARCDTPLRDIVGTASSAWSIGDRVINYYTLSLGSGIAPLDYALWVGVYHEGEPSGLDVLDAAGAPAGKSYELGTIELTPSRGRTHESLNREKLGLRPLAGSPQVAAGLELGAYALAQAAFHTGDRLSVLLEWRHATTGRLPDYCPTLRLVRDGRVLVALDAAPVYGRYPTSWWDSGEMVLDWRDLVIPLDIEGGPAELQVLVDGESPVSLGQIEIEAILRLFSVPPRQIETAMLIGGFAELVGYDLQPAHPAYGEAISLTLYWRAIGPALMSYVVFTHLLSGEGKLIAQHDAPPASATLDRPTTGWLAGEYIVDHHLMEWVIPDYQGRAVLEVGFYDPISGRRVVTPRGDSRLLLPSSIMIR